MRSYPDQSCLPEGFAAAVVARATDGGILRVELERMSGQTCSKWFPLMQAIAADHGLQAVRHRYAEGTFTKFTMARRDEK